MTHTMGVLGSLLAGLVAIAVLPVAWAQPSSAASTAPIAPPSNLYAVEIKTGPNWDSAKSANEQAHFREHSANLKKMRGQGNIVLGARYADKGLVVVQAVSADDVHAMMKQDPSIQAKTFVYELHEFNVFYGGAVQSKKRG